MPTTYSVYEPRHTKRNKKKTQRYQSSKINNISLFVSFPFFPITRTNQIREITSSCVCVWVMCVSMVVVIVTHIVVISCDPSPRTRANKEQRLQSSTTTTSSSSSYYLSAPSPPSMASRGSGGGDNGTTQRKRDGSTAADRMPSRWYTVLALPFPDQRLGRRDINTFGQGGIYTSSRAGYFSNQEQQR